MPLITHLKSRHYLFLFLFLSAFVPIALALLSQYVFGLAPCHLCDLQRIPYALMALLVLFGLYLSKRYLVLTLMLIGFISSSLLAGYHVGVEKGYIALDTGCVSNGYADLTPEELLEAFNNNPQPRCDKPTLIFGLSMAFWNLVYSLGMTVIISYLLFYRRRQT